MRGDIVAETISDHPAGSQHDSERKPCILACAHAKVDGGDDPRETYRLYYDYEIRVDRLRPHQVLRVNRGEAQKVLRISIDVDERDWRGAIAAVFRPDRRSASPISWRWQRTMAAHRLLLPAIERDVRRTIDRERRSPRDPSIRIEPERTADATPIEPVQHPSH